MNQKRTAICALIFLLLVMVGILLTPRLLYSIRLQQFEQAQELVRSQNGSLSFDLVDGNYILNLEGEKITDESIEKMIPTLLKLPTGFTFIGPGESRNFSVNLIGTSVTSSGIEQLCKLKMTWFQMAGGELSEEDATHLSRQKDLTSIMIMGTKMSENATKVLENSHRIVLVESNAD